jgi:(1->4)-alpha-D-glucan 1-alpha-D-glucosylmutase
LTLIIPTSIYRIQVSNQFSFEHVKAIVPYLSELGISHLYLSPIFKAVKGSTHGYDILDPNTINEELGGKDAFAVMVKEAKLYGLEIIQDIVPNHLAYTPINNMMSNLMQKGRNSKFHDFFDIDWNHPSWLKDKLLAPFLEQDLKDCMENGEIQLVFNASFALKYKNKNYPIRTGTIKTLLGSNYSAKNYELEDIEDAISEEQIQKTLDLFNQNVEALKTLISMQIFALENWKTAFQIINYRRFFDIKDLICLNTDRVEVFEYTHRLAFQLLEQGIIAGVRVDHVDGLKDPREYLKRIRRRAPDCFVIVEKILSDKERLPSSWSVQGTTGYDFLNALNSLFVCSDNESFFESIYDRYGLSEEKVSFDTILYECKKFAAKILFSGDVDNLTRLLLYSIKNHHSQGSFTDLKEALTEVIVALPVYRTYFDTSNRIRGIEYLESSIKKAKERNRKLWREFEEIENLLQEGSSNALNFFARLQQFTGAITAKGFEDTALYVYTRLLSLNEVGGNPSKFGTTKEDFYDFLNERQRNWPASINASSTHDTKRGEDARARLNVLSEIPFEFGRQIESWISLNRKKKKIVRGKNVPDKNEEYYFYQAILGSYPCNEEEVPEFKKRMEFHVTKALREAKIHTSWLNPNEEYEIAARNFISKLFEPQEAFLKNFLRFQRKIAYFGCLNSLSQTLIKITSPGIPEFYQGSELWNLSLVDPDNRRPVDFQKRKRFLSELKLRFDKRNVPLQPEEGKIKLYEITKALQIRKENKELYEKGKLLPLKVKGIFRDNIIAFARKNQRKYAITVVPRFLTTLLKENEQMNRIDWKDTEIQFPHDAPVCWKDVFTEKDKVANQAKGSKRIRAAEILEDFPVSLLVGSE